MSVTKKPLIEISFKEIDTNDSETLFYLLIERVHSISHKSPPKYETHKKFIESKPYRYWYLIYEDSKAIGSFYIQNDNSIGLNLIIFSLKSVKTILDYIKNEFEPLDPVASKTPSYFYINVAYSNNELKEILTKLDCIPIQTSYKLN